MIDVHAHILPAMDDGAKDVPVSVAMLKMLAEQGVTDVIATPHFNPRYNDSIEQFLTYRERSYKELSSSIAGINDLPRIRLGAEATVCVDMAKFPDIGKLCIEGTRYMLTEIDIRSFGDWFYNTVFEIRTKHDIIPIIAHIDRYIGILRSRTIIKILELGCVVQFNASAFLNGAVRRKLIPLIRQYPEQICLVGSDCHNTGTRKPRFDKFVQKADKYMGEGFLNYIEKRSKMLLEGKLIY